MKIYLSAGEESGDLHASYLAREILACRPDVSLAGMGGDRMRTAGVATLVDSRDHGVVGLTEVIGKLGRFRRDLNVLAAAMREDAVAFVAVDYGGFNARLLARARRMALKTFYYIPPKLWAWGRGRGKGIAAAADHILAVFPFEVEYWRRVGADVEFVGHPLLDITPAAAASRAVGRRTLGVGADDLLLLVLPGSRRQEVEMLWPAIAAALPALQRAFPSLRTVVAPGTALPPAFLNSLAPIPPGVSFTDEPAVKLMPAADAAIAASGTVTLELAIMDVPQLILYKVNRLTWEVGRRLVYVSHLGLPNVIMGAGVVPELLQGDVAPERISAAAACLLADEAGRERIKTSYAAIRASLRASAVPAYRRAAESIVEGLPA